MSSSSVTFQNKVTFKTLIHQSLVCIQSYPETLQWRQCPYTETFKYKCYFYWRFFVQDKIFLIVSRNLLSQVRPWGVDAAIGLPKWQLCFVFISLKCSTEKLNINRCSSLRSSHLFWFFHDQQLCLWTASSLWDQQTFTEDACQNLPCILTLWPSQTRFELSMKNKLKFPLLNQCLIKIPLCDPNFLSDRTAFFLPCWLMPKFPICSWISTTRLRG